MVVILNSGFRFLGTNRSAKARKTENGKGKTMKVGKSAILAIVGAACFSLSAYVMGAGHSSGTMHMSSAMHMNQSGHQTGTALASTKVKTSPTPPGHHFGWQKGRHNPHRSPTP